MDRYHNLMGHIHVPAGLNERVLESARKSRESAPRNRTASPVWKRGAFRGLVCGACALALVLGSFSLRWERDPAMIPVGSSSGEVPGNFVLSYEFGIVAGAVEHAVNDSLILRWEDGCCGFRIAGGEIVSVILETDRGVLLRNGQLVGKRIAENFDSEAVYGIAPVRVETLESLDGVELTLEVSFADGVRKSESYYLTAEELRVFVGEDGNEVLVPTLEGDTSEKIPALYAAGENSRWLSWPVKGSNTVSLSQSYGGRVPPGGGEPLVHAGIDIPGIQGLEIVSAAAGFVIETGFDSQKGNYLVVDHGDGLMTLYAQCQELLADAGDWVEEGAVIALLGSTGMSTGPHLHFEVRRDGEAQNPVSYFTNALRNTLCTK